jgi:SAM-dependent methyltransferase
LKAATHGVPVANTIPAFTGEYLVPGRHDWLERVHRARYEFAARFASGKRILDIASGSGYGSFLLACANAASVTGVDLLRENVAFARRSFQDERLSFEQGDITSWGETGAYDLVVCFETIEHIPDYQNALTNCRRLLKAGGNLIISSPNRVLSSPRVRFVTGKPENRFHVREFTPSELCLVLEAHGFAIRRSGVFGQVFQPTFGACHLLTKAYRKFLTRPFAATDLIGLSGRWQRPNYFTIVATASECPAVSND